MRKHEPKAERLNSRAAKSFVAPRHKTSKNPFLSSDWCSRRFTKHRKDASLPRGTIHSTRHTYTTLCLALGMAESKVMAMTGHVKHSTMLRYTHMVEELLQEGPTAALARFLPGREREEPQLLTEIALFFDGQDLPQKQPQRYV